MLYSNSNSALVFWDDGWAQPLGSFPIQTLATVAGVVTINGVVAGDGDDVQILSWDGTDYDLVTTVQIAGGAGAFTVELPLGQYRALYDQAGVRGMSALGTAGVDTFDIVIGSGLTAPQMTNVTPDENEEPGSPGAFSAVFSVARLTPIEFDLEDFPVGMEPVILVHYGNRNEMYTAFDYDGVGVWPFDVAPDSQITGTTTRHVKLLPRGGWPNTQVFVQAGAGLKAV